MNKTMAELGKIDKPEAASFKSRRKLYVVPTFPFEELAQEFKIETAKIERFWGEVREKINYFVATYGNINAIYLEGMNEEEKVVIETFEKFGKESNHYKLMKSLTDSGAKITGIEKAGSIKKSRLLFEEYSRSFLPEMKELHEGFFGKDIDFDGWRDYLVKNIQEIQNEMGRFVSDLIGKLPEDEIGVLFITDRRPVEYPQGMDVFMIRPPAFDEITKNIRDIESK